MKCVFCNNEAVMKINIFENGMPEGEISVCEKCANHFSHIKTAAFINFLPLLLSLSSHILNMPELFNKEETKEEICSKCFVLFKKYFMPMLEEIHKNYHIKENDQNNDIEKLKKKLKDAIKEERFEDAAKFRDELKKLENQS